MVEPFGDPWDLLPAATVPEKVHSRRVNCSSAPHSGFIGGKAMPSKGGPGEMGRKEPYAPPSAKETEGYVRSICSGQESVDESGLKGGSAALPGSTAGTEPSEKLSNAVGAKR